MKSHVGIFCEVAKSWRTDESDGGEKVATIDRHDSPGTPHPYFDFILFSSLVRC